MVSTPSGNFALYDRLLQGQLARRLEVWRMTDRLSYDDIVTRLRADDIAVSRETVGRWCRFYGLEVLPEPAPDAA